MKLGLEEKRVLVTGSSQGIGKATAESFLKEGAKVIINARNPEKLEETRRELSQKYGETKVYAFAGDMTSAEAICNLRDFCVDIVGGVDVLISNVGNGKATAANPLDADEWLKKANINLFGAVKLIDSFRDVLAESKGSSIVFVSSIAAKERSGAPYAYAASKNAILAFAKYLSADFAQLDIRVNAVLPGNVHFKGGRWEEILNSDYEGTVKMLNETVPMKRLGKPEEIADAIVFLASERSSFTTGASLVIDGGQLKRV